MSKQPVFNKSLFIVGAGAHVPYGFPTSKVLTESIKRLLSHGGTFIVDYPDRDLSSLEESRRDKVLICRLLRDSEIIERPNQNAANSYALAVGRALDSFVKNFGESQAYSIDSYLSKKIANSSSTETQKEIQIGKLLISYFIKKNEDRMPIGFHGDSDWIQYIINEFLLDGYESFFANPPKFFTFNYDNLFEKCLCHHLIRYHGLGKLEAVQLVTKLGIRHIYGHINSLGSEAPLAEPSVHLSAMKDMKVIGEERSGEYLDQTSKEIWEQFTIADTIYFLGFGFDKVNVELLFKRFPEGAAEAASGKRIYSTNVGLSPYDLSQIRGRTPVPIHFFQNVKEPEIVDCLKLLREKAPVFQPRPPSSTTRRRGGGGQISGPRGWMG